MAKGCQSAAPQPARLSAFLLANLTSLSPSLLPSICTTIRLASHDLHLRRVQPTLGCLPVASMQSHLALAACRRVSCTMGHRPPIFGGDACAYNIAQIDRRDWATRDQNNVGVVWPLENRARLRPSPSPKEAPASIRRTYLIRIAFAAVSSGLDDEPPPRCLLSSSRSCESADGAVVHKYTGRVMSLPHVFPESLTPFSTHHIPTEAVDMSHSTHTRSDDSAISTVPTEAINDFQSLEQSQLLDVVEQLRGQNLDTETNIPQIMVCGDTSRGKSSFLEAIGRIRFPVGHKAVSKRPNRDHSLALARREHEHQAHATESPEK